MTELDEDFQIKVDVGELLDNLDAESKSRLAQSIACDKAVIESVVDLLIDGFTEAGFWPDSDTITEQRKRLLEKTEPMMHEVCKHFMYKMAKVKTDAKANDRWAWQLFHAWPNETGVRRPSWPDYIPTPHPTDKEVATAIEAVKGGEND